METTVVIILGLVAIVLGAVLATNAPRHPARMNGLGQWGGGCFVGGLVLVASAFPMV